MSKVSVGSSNISLSNLDGRNDLGYGRSSSKFTGDKRQTGTSVFPYMEADEEIDSEAEEQVSDESIETVFNNQLDPISDAMGTGHFDPFTYVGGNTKLSEALGFSKNSISPIRGLYKGRAGGATGTKSGTVRSDGSTMSPTIAPGGDKYGWSAPLYQDDDSNDENWTLEDIAQNNLEESYLRTYIRSIILSEIIL